MSKDREPLEEEKLANRAEQKTIRETTTTTTQKSTRKRTTWRTDGGKQTFDAHPKAEVSTSALSKEVKERSTAIWHRPVASQRPSKPQIADFSSRQAVRHLLGLPNGSVPPLHLPGGPPVFLCMDLEAWEFDCKTILELGVTTLDLQKLPAYPNCNPWDLLHHMVYEHYIIEENRRRKNKKYSRSCPHMFLFGKSRNQSSGWLSYKYNKKFPNEASIKDRPIVLVGHGLPNDEKYLASLGIHPRRWPNLVGIIDTQGIAQGESFPLNLGRMLDRFRVPTPCAHNAGNDAAYTMHALLIFALYKDEWKSSEAMAKARSLLQKLQRSRRNWGNVLNEQREASVQDAKLQRQKFRQILKRRGTASSTELTVYDPAALNGPGGWRSRLP